MSVHLRISPVIYCMAEDYDVVIRRDSRPGLPLSYGINKHAWTLVNIINHGPSVTVIRDLQLYAVRIPLSDAACNA